MSAASSDEQAIRDLVMRWMQATQAGDVDTVLSLMTDDVVFLTPGNAPMRKAEFAAAARAMAQEGGPRFDGHNDIHEITIHGDIAWMWGQLHVRVTRADGTALVRSGPVMSVLRREGGRWRLARDANMLGAPGAAKDA